MDDRMQWENAPKDHLDTWKSLTKLITVSCVGIAIGLLLMAWGLL